MARIVTAIEIRAPIERVFDYATTAGNWPSWHPASRAVRGATDHPAAHGERITEEIQTGGRSWRAVWTVRERGAAAPLGDRRRGRRRRQGGHHVSPGRA
jgi:uncharacterized protein YndB with AHSA1/START domain